MTLKYLDGIEVKGRNILARFDFNVPLKDGEITDATRLDEALPTIQYMLEHGASKIVMMSHLGRPEGKFQAKYSLEPVAKYLAQKLRRDVVLTESPVASGVKSFLGLPETKLVLLENLRFHPGEEKNDPEFAKKLASYGDLYVNDAFGAAHRKHASIYPIVTYFKDQAVGGFLLRKEVEALAKIIENPKKPLMSLIGGAKVSDKIKTLERLLVSVDNIFIGGAMAYPFLKAQGIEIGKSLCSEVDLDLAKKILRQNNGKKILLPVDHIVAESFDGRPEECSTPNIPENKMGLDIGPKTCALYSKKLQEAKTIFWNGPFGLFENENFSKGTYAMAKALAESNAFTVVGGGDSVSAVKKSGLANKISHISTGGGATLEFIEQGQLPGIQALKFGV